jgi:dynein heavy chain
MDRLQSTYYLENHPRFKDANSEFTKLHSNLDDYQKKTYDDWVRTMDGNPAKRLDNSLISKVPTTTNATDNTLISKQGGMLENNFDRTLLRIFQEVHYWEKLAYMVPAQVCLSLTLTISLCLPSTVCPQLIS